MPLRELIRISRNVWSTKRRERQEVLQGYDWIFEQYYPWHKRIWWRYLYWVSYVLRTTVAIYTRLKFLKGVEAYCIVADRLFGGDRYPRFLEAREKEIAEQEEKNRRDRKHFNENLEKTFTLRVDKEAEENPRFTPSQKHSP